jgi:hypothetical protein
MIACGLQQDGGGIASIFHSWFGFEAKDPEISIIDNWQGRELNLEIHACYLTM